MKQPVMFQKLLRDWIAIPRTLDECIGAGYAAREQKEPNWVPLKGLGAMSDWHPPKAYAAPGAAYAYNKAVRKFRRRLAFSAFVARISLSELEARLETYALLMAAMRPDSQVR
jgi:hypothetical protein